MDLSIDLCPNYRDKRGNLIQFITEQFLAENNLPLGQIYLLTFDGQNIVRGNHYHLHSSEIFCLIQGEVEIALEDIETKERFSKVLSAKDDSIYRVRIGPKIAHAVKSISPTAVLVSYASRVYDPLDEDKFIYTLL
jgi:dTDP-4-dehydrorhamnose 3,5-epimerase-like enzyme